MDVLKIPCSPWKITVGTIVVLNRFPQTKWVVKNGWYSYMGQKYNGWHFSSIPAQTIIPVNQHDLQNLTVISGGEVGDGTVCCTGGSNESDNSDTSTNTGTDCNCGCKPLTPPSIPPVHECPPKPYKQSPPPFPPCPCPPKPFPMPPRSVEMYLQGVNYVIGQLVWLKTGELYQAAKNFKSNWKAESLQADIECGYLVPIAIDVIIGNNIRFAVNFAEVFGTDNPVKAEADAYLASFEKPVTPLSGISFINTDNLSPTYSVTFGYYLDPTTEELLFMSEGTQAVLLWQQS